MTRQEEKAWLRAAIGRIAARQSPDYGPAADRAIAAHLLAMPEYLAARTVLAFTGWPYLDILSPLLADAQARGVSLCLPRGGDSLALGRTGPDGALTAEDVPLDAVDFALIPCVTCSPGGHRLGDGRGWYDRLLAHYRAGGVVLCREKLLREEIPLDPWDYPVPWVLTERGLREDGVPARLG